MVKTNSKKFYKVILQMVIFSKIKASSTWQINNTFAHDFFKIKKT